MGSPKVVLALGAALVMAILVALWWSEASEQGFSFDEATVEADQTPAPARAPLAQAMGAAARPVASGSREAGAPVSTAQPIRPGVNAPLPPDQWPARVRPTERTVVAPPPPDYLPERTRDDIERAVHVVKPLITRCFSDNAQKYLGDQKVVLKFTIEGVMAGKFRGGEVVESSIVDPWVQACFLEALAEGNYPPPNGGGRVTITQAFSFIESPDAGEG